jgi:hypothetical protein
MTNSKEKPIDVLLQEKRTFSPSESFKEQALVIDQDIFEKAKKKRIENNSGQILPVNSIGIKSGTKFWNGIRPMPNGLSVER